jgi:hypothetical protein
LTAKHRPDDQTRGVAERAASLGFTEPQIGTLIGVSDRTLRKHYRRELATGHLKANYEVGKRLFQKCIEGDKAALIFWAKCRMNWREADPATVNVEATAQAQGAVLHVPMPMDVETWNKYAAEQQAASARFSQSIRDNMEAGKPVLRSVPLSPIGESEIIELDSEPAPRKRRWSTGPNPFSW